MESSKDDSPAEEEAEAEAEAEKSSGEALAASNQMVFSEGERVLAHHGPLLYGAKVKKIEYLDNQQRYYVHYLGIIDSWDEWVDGDRLMKLTEENVQKQKELEKNFSADKNPKLGRSPIKPRSSNDTNVDKEDLQKYVGRSKKRKGDYGIEEEDTGSTKTLVKIQFPLTLKKQLADDWEFVTQLGKLVKLPRNPNVDGILKKYLAYRSKKNDMAAESVGEILNGMRNYFDKALPVMLLYKKERHQYDEAIVDNVSPSAVYGAEHLLRLFVKLPELLAYVNMEEEALSQLQQKLQDFLKFLQKNQSAFFLSTYESSNILEETDEEQND
ncbi:hypothetical protein AAC387_Pa03g4308 [Persea americana]